MTRSITSRAAAAAVIALTLAAGCSSNTEPAAAPGTSGAVASGTTPGTTARATVERPAGPAADVSEELTGGNGVFLGQITGVDLAGNGYVEHEYVAAGTATTYVADGDPADDGAIDVTEGETDDYRTRIVVRRPENPDDFNGTVVMEWLNVSGGLDASPDFSYAADELLRNGYAWVGVSAQKIGVEGGEVAVTVPIGEGLSGQGLKALDPARYGTLSHPGDGYSYDIFTQVARAVRGEGGADLLGGAEVDQILAAGESQSGFALTTYVNAIAPETQAFDGYLIHSRGGPGLPLGTPGAAISIVDAITGGPTTIRSDIAVPVLQLETETDLVSVIGFLPARQPDTDLLRTWEVAGTAHADRA
ncbi:MAG: alpha/beta hydrolase domain-containing protein [Acidimicrobiales bacterium]